MCIFIPSIGKREHTRSPCAPALSSIDPASRPARLLCTTAGPQVCCIAVWPAGRPSQDRLQHPARSQRVYAADQHTNCTLEGQGLFLEYITNYFWCIFVHYSKDHVVENELIYHVRLCSVQCKDQMLGRFLLVSGNNFGIRIKYSTAIFLLRSLDQENKVF
jgi:hypothetical protein